jgi:hypothetical protein
MRDAQQLDRSRAAHAIAEPQCIVSSVAAVNARLPASAACNGLAFRNPKVRETVNLV